jgi:hypothetical protein
MPALHIAGLPVEEVLLAALAAAGPLIALIGLEFSTRVKRLRARWRDRRLRSGPDGDARLQGYEFGGAGSGQGVDG